MVVGVDEARNDDPVAAVDHRNVARRRDLRAYLANLAVVNQHVGPGEIADLRIEGEEDGTLDEDAPCTLQALELILLSALRHRIFQMPFA
jgi:hypothetical protein